MRGFVQGMPTLQLAEELDLDYGTLLKRRHQIQQLALAHKPTEPLSDEVTEADEMFQNAGEKNTLLQTIPCVAAPTIGLDWARWTMTAHLFWASWDVPPDTQQTTIQPQVEHDTLPNTTLYTDESSAYTHIAETGRAHATVCHSRREYARDDDGDGFCEVHCNAQEGIWTGLRNFLRLFGGVHKKYLAAYIAAFEWAHILKRVTVDFLRTLMIPSFTYLLTSANLESAFHNPQVTAAPATVLVSGPSRTADIEMTLTIGVHGPGELHVFVMR